MNQTEATPNLNNQAVVLLHGIGSHPLALNGFRRRFARLRYHVCSPAYPSMSADIDQILDIIHPHIKALPPVEILNFVTHSFGGIVARAYIARFAPPNLGRVVSFAPPNHGTEYVDVFSNWRLFQSIMGPAALTLSTQPSSPPHQLPPPTFELGIIAGTRALNPLSYWLLPKPNDGIVSVASTRLEGMKAHMTVPYPHRVMLSIPWVQQKAINFVKTGYFSATTTRAEQEPDH